MDVDVRNQTLNTHNFPYVETAAMFWPEFLIQSLYVFVTLAQTLHRSIDQHQLYFAGKNSRLVPVVSVPHRLSNDYLSRDSRPKKDET